MDLGKHKIAKTNIIQLFFAQTNYAKGCIKISNSMPNTCFDPNIPLGVMVTTTMFWRTPQKSQITTLQLQPPNHYTYPIDMLYSIFFSIQHVFICY